LRLRGYYEQPRAWSLRKARKSMVLTKT